MRIVPWSAEIQLNSTAHLWQNLHRPAEQESMKKIADCMMSDLSLMSRMNNRYQQLISGVLPENLMKHIVFVRIDQGSAKITVSSSAFAARIRFHNRDIQRQLSQSTPIHSVSLHVLPAGTVLPAPRPSEREKPKASNKTVSSILQVANSIDAPDLKQSLERLAKNLAKDGDAESE